MKQRSILTSWRFRMLIPHCPFMAVFVSTVPRIPKSRIALPSPNELPVELEPSNRSRPSVPPVKSNVEAHMESPMRSTLAGTDSAVPQWYVPPGKYTRPTPLAAAARARLIAALSSTLTDPVAPNHLTLSVPA
jgi:hypothetical protein